MRRIPLLLIPGMDGTGLLFRELIAALGDAVAVTCVGLPPDGPQSFERLVGRIKPPDVPYAVLGESFSGPLALMLADRDPRARAVVLAASFASCPSRLLAWLRPLVRSPLFWAGLPDPIVRRYLLGEDAGAESLAALRVAGRSLGTRTLAARLRQVGAADVEKELSRCRVPLLYLRAKRDRLVGPQAAEKMRRLNPNVEIEDVDAPHLLLQRAPRQAASRIAAFLERAVPPTTVA